MHFYNGICFQLGCLGWLSSSTDGKKQIHERKSFVFGTLYRLSSIFYTCDLYYFDPQNPDFLVIIEWKAVMSYMLGYSKSIQVCVCALYNVFSWRRKPLITCLDNMYKIQLGFFCFVSLRSLWLWSCPLTLTGKSGSDSRNLWTYQAPTTLGMYLPAVVTPSCATAFCQRGWEACLLTLK